MFPDAEPPKHLVNDHYIDFKNMFVDRLYLSIS